MSQKVDQETYDIDRAEVWQDFNASTLLVSEGVALSKRHYERYRQLIKDNYWVLNSNWFGQWMQVHQGYFMDEFHPDRRRETDVT